MTQKNHKKIFPSSFTNAGFTLIELLVVIAIIGLLASLSLVALNSAREKARNSRRVSDMKQLQTALELKYSEDKNYPSSVSFDGTGKIITSDDTVYMDQVPTNPKPWDDGDACSDWNQNYSYSTENPNQTYTIEYCISEETGGISAGIHSATPSGLASE